MENFRKSYYRNVNGIEQGFEQNGLLIKNVLDTAGVTLNQFTSGEMTHSE